jgi:hypothetical protein
MNQIKDIPNRECYFWYWGNATVPASTCLLPKHKRKLCKCKCKDFSDTHLRVLSDLNAYFRGKK